MKFIGVSPRKFRDEASGRCRHKGTKAATVVRWRLFPLQIKCPFQMREKFIAANFQLASLSSRAAT